MFDIIIVGSGPAGSIAAREANQQGKKVLLLDESKFPRYKPCGGGFGSKVFDVLKEDEIKDFPSAFRNKGLYVVSPSRKHEAKMIKEGLLSYLVSRVDLDNYLHESALALGGEFKPEKVIDAGYLDDKKGVWVKTIKSTYEGKMLIIANGVYSKLRAKFGFPNPYSRRAVGLTVNSETKLGEKKMDEVFGKDRTLTIFFGIVKRGYGWVFPAKDRLNIGVGCTLKYFKHARKVYEEFLSLVQDHYNFDSSKLNKPRGYIVPFYKPIKKSYTDNVLIAGDAGYFVSALTAEGICYALKTGQFAARVACDALSKKDYSAKNLSIYQKIWMNDFGKDLIRYSLPLQNILYKNDFRMETVVRLAEADEKFMGILTDTIMGAITYKQAFWKIIGRSGIALVKSLKK